jgi:ubiquinone/menaquinone biosynthesis C-methylase UbiE
LTVSEDPEGKELKVIEKYATFKGKEVLEVGCGEGRLTFQYAASARSVYAIDASSRAIAEARKAVPKKLAFRIGFHVGRGERLRLADGSVDLVFFSWSLCCTDIPAMGKAIDEAWRVLRQDGILLSMQPSLYQPFPYGMVDYLINRNNGPTIVDEPERQARLALRHASFVEGKFDFVAEEEFPIYTHYGTTRGFLRKIMAEAGVRFKELDGRTKQKIMEIITSMKTRKGVKDQQNVILTVLRKAAT